MNQRVVRRIVIALFAVLVLVGVFHQRSSAVDQAISPLVAATVPSAQTSDFPASNFPALSEATNAPSETAQPSLTLDPYSDYFLPTTTAEPANGAIKVSYYGTTMLLFDDGETQILIDSFLTRLPKDLLLGGPIKTETAMIDPVLARPEFGPVEAIFVLHSHFDHGIDLAYIAQQTGAQVYGSESTLNIARGGAIPENKLTLYQPGVEVPIGQFTITVLPSKHSPPVPGLNDDLGQMITEPLQQPTSVLSYVEGGSYDILLKHGNRSVLVKGSANWLEGALDDVQANVFFLSTAAGGAASQGRAFLEPLYEQTVGKVQPQLVIPIHWDDFLLPLSENLTFLSADQPPAFNFLIERLTSDGIQFGIMQGFQSVMLFGDGSET